MFTTHYFRVFNFLSVNGFEKQVNILILCGDRIIIILIYEQDAEDGGIAAPDEWRV